VKQETSFLPINAHQETKRRYEELSDRLQDRGVGSGEAVELLKVAYRAAVALCRYQPAFSVTRIEASRVHAQCICGGELWVRSDDIRRGKRGHDPGISCQICRRPVDFGELCRTIIPLLGDRDLFPEES